MQKAEQVRQQKAEHIMQGIMLEHDRLNHQQIKQQVRRDKALREQQGSACIDKTYVTIAPKRSAARLSGQKVARRHSSSPPKSPDHFCSLPLSSSQPEEPVTTSPSPPKPQHLVLKVAATPPHTTRQHPASPSDVGRTEGVWGQIKRIFTRVKSETFFRWQQAAGTRQFVSEPARTHTISIRTNTLCLTALICGLTDSPAPPCADGTSRECILPSTDHPSRELRKTLGVWYGTSEDTPHK